jgi:hypothetical protein
MYNTSFFIQNNYIKPSKFDNYIQNRIAGLVFCRKLLKNKQLITRIKGLFGLITILLTADLGDVFCKFTQR